MAHPGQQLFLRASLPCVAQAHLSSYGLCSYGLNRCGYGLGYYAVHSYGLPCVAQAHLCSYDHYSYGLYSYGLHSHGPV